MTKAERYCDEAERLRGEATPGEWRATRYEGDPGDWFLFVEAGEEGCVCDILFLQPGGNGTQAHIVAMQNSQEALLRVVRAAEVACAEYFADENEGDSYLPGNIELREALDDLPTKSAGDDNE